MVAGDAVDLVMEVDSEAGLKSGSRLVVNTLAVTEPDNAEIKRDEHMEELTGKMFVLSLSVSVSQ